MSQPTIDQILTELRRELETRKRLYPTWIANGKITQETADHRIACLEGAIERLEQSIERPQSKYTQTNLFGE